MRSIISVLGHELIVHFIQIITNQDTNKNTIDVFHHNYKREYNHLDNVKTEIVLVSPFLGLKSSADFIVFSFSI